VSKAKRHELWPRLDTRAKNALLRDFGDWPADPLGDDRIEAMLADVEHLARAVLRCYPFPSSNGVGWETPWAWKAHRNDNTGWRPIDADWQPDPYIEWPTCRPNLDPAPFEPDLRPTAFRLLYWLSAVKTALEASDPSRVLRAAWRTVTELADLRADLYYGKVVERGGGHSYGSHKGGRRSSDDGAPMRTMRKLAFQAVMQRFPHAGPTRWASDVVVTRRDLWGSSTERAINNAKAFYKCHVKEK
jgi:hypothetical protein